MTSANIARILVRLSRDHRAAPADQSGLAGFLLAPIFAPWPCWRRLIGIVALGQTFVIIGGGIDLSVPWVLNWRRGI